MRRLLASDDEITSSQDAVIEQHGSLVTQMARRLASHLASSLSVDDLTQAGVIGLLEASKNYKAEKGASFETYARIRIRGSILDEARKGDWAPRSVHRNRRKLYKAVREVENKIGRDARDREVADHLELSMQEHHQILQDTHNTRLSMIGDPGIEEAINGPDYLEPTLLEGLEYAQSIDAVRKAIEKLSEREQQVLQLYYQEELNLKTVGKVLGVSESRISQIHSKAMLQLQDSMKNA